MRSAAKDTAVPPSPSISGVGGSGFLGRSPRIKARQAPGQAKEKASPDNRLDETRRMSLQRGAQSPKGDDSYHISRNFEHSMMDTTLQGGKQRKEKANADASPAGVANKDTPHQSGRNFKSQKETEKKTKTMNPLNAFQTEEPAHSSKEEQMDFEERTAVAFGVPSDLHDELLSNMASNCGVITNSKRLGKSAVQMTFASADGRRKALERDGMVTFADNRIAVVRPKDWSAMTTPAVRMAAPLLIGDKTSDEGRRELLSAEDDLCTVSHPWLMTLPFAETLLLPLLRIRRNRKGSSSLPEGALKRKR